MYNNDDNIEKIINNLWKEFRTKEKYLFDNNLSERCISFNFAKALALSQKFDNYDIDCEYNREKNEPKEIYRIKSQFEDRLASGEIKSYEELEKNKVYPDIIIHKRGSNNENFIVIELKKILKI